MSHWNKANITHCKKCKFSGTFFENGYNELQYNRIYLSKHFSVLLAPNILRGENSHRGIGASFPFYVRGQKFLGLFFLLI